jgi:hypothetical protein
MIIYYMIMIVDGKRKQVKRCPHCDGNDLIVDTEVLHGREYGFVECLTEDCFALMRGKNETHAVKMWNRRPKRK